MRFPGDQIRPRGKGSPSRWNDGKAREGRSKARENRIQAKAFRESRLFKRLRPNPNYSGRLACAASAADRPPIPAALRRVGRDRNAPLQPYGAGPAGAEQPPPSRFPGRPRRDPRGLTARECCQCVQRRAPQFSLRSVTPSREAVPLTRDRPADVFAIIARVSISVEKLFSVCSQPQETSFTTTYR